MTYEAPKGYEYYAQFPEGYPSPGLFNLDQMTDEHVIVLGAALDMQHERMCEAGDYPVAESETSSSMLEHLGADLARLTVLEPERGKNLLMRLAKSDNPYEMRTAIAAGVPLSRLDFEAACDVMLAAQDHARTIPGGDLDMVWIRQSHMAAMLPPELAAELNRRMYEAPEA